MAITWQSTHKTWRWMEKTRRWEKDKKVGEHQISDKCIGQFQSSSKNATDKWTFEKNLCVWHCKNIGLLSGEGCGSVRWVSASLEGEITIENTLEETERVVRSQIEVQRDQCWFIATFSIFCIDHKLYLIETCSSSENTFGFSHLSTFHSSGCFHLSRGPERQLARPQFIWNRSLDFKNNI